MNVAGMLNTDRCQGIISFMKRNLFSLLVLAGIGAAGFPDAPPPSGTIEGTIRFTGKVPEGKLITTADGATFKHFDLVVEAKSKGVKDVVVWLDDVPAQPKVEKAAPAVIDQVDMIFVPRVVAVRYGQPVRFENSDLCNHSVQALGTVPANQFNVFVQGAQPYTATFDLQKRPVMIGCTLHGWMRAWVYVVPHPWFAVSDSQGRFLLKDVPAGKHTLQLDHADTALQERRAVEISAGKTATLTVDWDKVP
jgi:plastocyanin